MELWYRNKFQVKAAQIDYVIMVRTSFDVTHRIFNSVENWSKLVNNKSRNYFLRSIFPWELNLRKQSESRIAVRE